MMCSLFVGIEGDGFDDDRLLRHVLLKRAALAGRCARDTHHNIHACAYLAEHRVADSVGAWVAKIEGDVVGDVDEELRCGRVWVASASHSNGTDIVFQAVARLVLDWRSPAFFLAQIRIETASLNHETIDDK